MACVSIRIRRDIKENWESVNPILKEGEMSFCIDEFMIKFGDGKTPWKDLDCVIDIAGLKTALTEYETNLAEFDELMKEMEDAIAKVDGITGSSLSASVTNRCLTLSFNAGSVQ